MAGSISWKEFEALVERLHRSFSKGGKVLANERLPGRNSGQQRQIDISIRADIGGETILMIVECKRWNRRVDVKAVEAFNGVKEDVGAHLGIMVSTKGFTPAARKTAATKGISLYRYEDTLTTGWPNGLETNVLMEIWELTPTVARFKLRDGTEEDLITEEGHDFVDRKTGKVEVLATILRKFWDSIDSAKKTDCSWAVEFETSCPDRPEIAAIILGAESKRVRGYKSGRLQFEGFVDDSKGQARVEGWKMVFAGPFSPLLGNTMAPRSETLSICMRTTHVRTQDPKSEKVIDCVYDGVLELTVKNKTYTHIPTRSDAP